MKQLWSPWRMKYIQSNKVKDCIFCRALSQLDDEQNLVIARGKSVFAMLNLYPYTSGHLMIVPNAHVANLDELEPATRAEMMDLTAAATLVLRQVYHPEGFNLGINMGEVAGAGIAEHIHMHVVPRWGGDTNFMSSLASTRVLPESLQDTFLRLRLAWKH